MMRYTILLVFAAVLVTVGVQPAIAEGTVGFGGKAGINLANVTGNDAEGAETRTGFAVGGYLDFQISPNVSFHPEALYFQKGTKDEVDDLTATIAMDYLEVPMLIMVKFPSETSTITPVIFAGPSVGLNIGAKVKAEARGASAEADFDNAKSIDFGIAFGGGAEIAAGNNKLTLDVRYTLGLTNPLDDGNPNANDLVMDDGSAPDIKNGVISIMVGFGM